MASTIAGSTQPSRSLTSRPMETCPEARAADEKRIADEREAEPWYPKHLLESRDAGVGMDGNGR
jgi:hypothetical protein